MVIKSTKKSWRHISLLFVAILWKFHIFFILNFSFPHSYIARHPERNVKALNTNHIEMNAYNVTEPIIIIVDNEYDQKKNTDKNHDAKLAATISDVMKTLISMGISWWWWLNKTYILRHANDAVHSSSPDAFIQENLFFFSFLPSFHPSIRVSVMICACSHLIANSHLHARSLLTWKVLRLIWWSTNWFYDKTNNNHFQTATKRWCVERTLGLQSWRLLWRM